jgi:formate-dependent nitrite reductase membrane component NrfD
VTGGRASQSAARELLGGKWTGTFWSVVVFLGLLVPLAMEIVESRKHLRPAIMAPILILLGGIALRWILLVAGQETTYASF